MRRYEDVLIIYNSIEYLIPYLGKKGILARERFSRVLFSGRVIRKIFKGLNLPLDLWYKEWKWKISTANTVIIIAPQPVSFIRYLKRKNRNLRIIYWYWDPVFRIGIPPQEISQIAEVWSFDPADCIKYNMTFNTTFYLDNIKLKECNYDIDAVFLGLDKGREEELNKIKEVLDRSSLNAFFRIVAQTKKKTVPESDRMHYADYLELISKSKAIVDVKPIGQSGLTVRPMECIFFRKKLITNDFSIVDEDFYDPQNIFIIDRDKEENLSQFINTPYVELKPSVVEKYDVLQWIDRFNAR